MSFTLFEAGTLLNEQLTYNSDITGSSIQGCEVEMDMLGMSLLRLGMSLLRYSAEEHALRFILGAVAVVIGLIATLVQKVKSDTREQERLTVVAAKYTGEIASMIAKKMFWTGQTAEQLRDSLGAPVAIDRKVLKTRVREVWKYNQIGTNRYALRITLDNGIVATWSQVGG